MAPKATRTRRGQKSPEIVAKEPADLSDDYVSVAPHVLAGSRVALLAQPAVAGATAPVARM